MHADIECLALKIFVCRIMENISNMEEICIVNINLDKFVFHLVSASLRLPCCFRPKTAFQYLNNVLNIFQNFGTAVIQSLKNETISKLVPNS